MKVYFIRTCRDDGPWKIGIAVSPVRRLHILQTGNPDLLELVASADGGRAEEFVLHKTFAQFRIRGEWFNHCNALAALANEVRATGFIPAHLRPKSVEVTHSASNGDLLGEITNFLTTTGMSPTRFGRLSVRDGKFVADLKNTGRRVWPETAEKVRRFIAEQSKGEAA